ncbi:MAG: recombinase family protein [Chloroflexi bacterium]|nr:recombinase family protein [Chloroflexota bacterium]
MQHAAIYVKEAAGYPEGENTQEHQTRECESYCNVHGLRITARYYDSAGCRQEFQQMMEDATKDAPPFDTIVVWKLRNFSWSLEETILCRDRLRANGVTLISTKESSAPR